MGPTVTHERDNGLSEETHHAAFRSVPRTGVIYVTVEAERRGFHLDAPGWCNLGQGQPETGPLPGAPARIAHIDVHQGDLDYAPVPGLWELREAVASLYNSLFRKGMKSQYSAENVAIWIWNRIKPRLPKLAQVTVHETCTSKCEYRG